MGTLRILMLAPDYPPAVRTGIGTYVQSMARALVRHGHEVHVLTCETYGGPADGEDNGVQVHRREVLRIPGVRRAIGLLPREWSRQHLPQHAMTRPGRRIGLGITSLVEALRLKGDFDAVEAPDYFAPGWTIALAKCWPVLTVLHTPLQLEARYSELPERAYLDLTCALERWGSVLSTGLSAPSRMVRDELVSLGWSSARRSSIDPIGVDVEDFPYVPHQGQSGRILLVGHVIPRKGHDVLAAAAGLLGRTNPKLEVVVLGSYREPTTSRNGFRARLEAAIEQSGVPWRFVGHVNRHSLLDWYRDSAVVVVPSRFESFSMAAVEGMLAGKPVVLTDRCGLAELCEPGAESGIWVSSAGDPVSLAESLRDALDLSARGPEVGEAARETALRCADINCTVMRKVRRYESLR